MRAIICDTRQQAGKHEVKHLAIEAAGETLSSSKLHVGDYAEAPAVAVDTKRSIQELAQNLRGDHRRFRDECLRARADGTRLVVLTENVHGVASLDDLAAWVEPMHEFRRRRGAKVRLSGSQIAAACATMTERYGVEFRFCSPLSCGRAILAILREGGRDG
ncbi:hypothetical protein HLV35_07430 [Eggerthellaceae bacterium zg-997]|nr:hypothetical protein [Eggerthellaceae bacterium zg-997]